LEASRDSLSLGRVGVLCCLARSRAYPRYVAPTGSAAWLTVFPLPNHQPTPTIRSPTNELLTSPFISHGAHPMASSSSSSSNFQLIINNALDAYKRRTKNDLLAHPLAVKLQSCNTPSAILAVLQEQIQGLDQSRNSDDRWTRWLDPTVNVLFALSATLGEGVGLVCVITRTCLIFEPSFLFDRYSHQPKWYLPESASFFRCVFFLI
jgi:hypothetical protein